MLSTRTTNAIRAAVAVATLGFASASSASFIAAIDNFTVTRNGSVLFNDSFGDGAEPPSVPAGNGALTYSTFGAPGNETGGKFFIDSNDGLYQPAGDGTARLRSNYRLNSSTDASSSGLKINSAFKVTGLFDMEVGNSPFDLFTIDVTSGTGPAFGSPTGGQVWSIAVGKGSSGLDTVRLVLQDYTAHTIQVVASVALNLAHDQILLQFDRDNLGNNLAHASFQYVDGGVAGTAIQLGDAVLFQSSNYVRAQFTVQQETALIPLPGTLWLLFAGCAGLFAFRRRAA